MDMLNLQHQCVRKMYLPYQLSIKKSFYHLTHPGRDHAETEDCISLPTTALTTGQCNVRPSKLKAVTKHLSVIPGLSNPNRNVSQLLFTQKTNVC